MIFLVTLAYVNSLKMLISMKMRCLSAFLLIVSFSLPSCKKGCVDKNNKLIGQCPDTLEVVCGCNDKSYKNSCEALKEGISKENQTSGACK